MADAAAPAAPGVAYGSPRGRWILFATVLGSGIAFLDATVVNIALPAIGRRPRRRRSTGCSGRSTPTPSRWPGSCCSAARSAIATGGGGCSCIGVAWFAVASLLCAIAPNVETLIAARALQGVGGALLAPGRSPSSRRRSGAEDRGPAIGAWSGLGGIAGALGPLVGGWLIAAASWRLHLPDQPAARRRGHLGRAAPRAREPRSVAARAPARHRGRGAGGRGARRRDVRADRRACDRLGTRRVVVVSTVVCAVALVAFVLVERRAADPLVPRPAPAHPPVRRGQHRHARRSTPRSAARCSSCRSSCRPSLGYSPAGGRRRAAAAHARDAAALRPRRALAQRIGPRLPMTVGPIVVGCGMLLDDAHRAGRLVRDRRCCRRCSSSRSGCACTVAPLTTTVLAAASDADAGVAQRSTTPSRAWPGCWRSPSSPWPQGWAPRTTSTRRPSTRRSTAASSSPASSPPPAASSRS